MTKIDINRNKEMIISLLRSTNRKGIDNVIANLEDWGFFIAPASASHHLNKPGGLAQHSINVYLMACNTRNGITNLRPELDSKLREEEIIISSLLHDVCKAEIYKPTIKKQKTPEGFWKDLPGYEIDYSTFPLGHGEKSVIQLLRWNLDLTEDEIAAIRWHMTSWELPFQSYEAKENLNKAKEKNPLLTLIQTADGIASNILESNY